MNDFFCGFFFSFSGYIKHFFYNIYIRYEHFVIPISLKKVYNFYEHYYHMNKWNFISYKHKSSA